ncbi:MAG: hypothetical protein FGM46_05035 [Ferruginibacter sp.]|nr:hypothetical protein [Ferruginibacter sp.]
MKTSDYINLQSSHKSVKTALYLYFFLLIFEGALRRWVLPQFSGPLLLIRDPLAVYILIVAWKFRILRLNGYVIVIGFISLLSLYTALLFGHGNIYIALYGLRITLLHFPLLFVIESLFTKDDLIRVARYMIILCIPMLVLILFQFFSPQTAWINKGLGENVEGAGFSGALGFYRPPGTFSFTNGLVLFFTTCAAFIYWGIDYPLRLPKWLIYLSLSCLLLSIPFSISRSLLFGVAITSLLYFFISMRAGMSFIKISILISFVVLVYLIFGSSQFLGTGIEVLQKRFELAAESEGGIQGTFLNRYLGGIGDALNASADFPFWGYGIGLGSNFGSQYSTGKMEFLISEGEWGRVLGEMGFLVGLLFLLTRLKISLVIIKKSYQAYINANVLPWLMMGNIFIFLLLGQWAQPTSLGFSVFFGGVTLAAIKVYQDDVNPAPHNIFQS